MPSSTQNATLRLVSEEPEHPLDTAVDTPFIVFVTIQDLNRHTTPFSAPAHCCEPAVQETVTCDETAGSVNETCKGELAKVNAVATGLSKLLQVQVLWIANKYDWFGVNDVRKQLDVAILCKLAHPKYCVGFTSLPGSLET
jgi:hypothetical protein